jgi:uncharacterized protein YdiU (UPF0061 family)
MINFTNSYSTLPDRFYQKVSPENFRNPTLLLFNHELAKELKIKTQGVSDTELAHVFSGQNILPGSEPMALVYAAHQFGHWQPQLGDGRAHLLGETAGFDLQLKGSGRTRFSRRGDGRSALGPVIREYIVSEAMHHLGVPSTRALAAVSTGEEVYRQTGPEPGGIFTRVAESHIRVGTFQYFAAKNDQEAVETLLNYSINRHYPELANIPNASEKSLQFLQAIVKKQATLIAKWLSYGFIHGVMNTDNFSVAGITIDFGPCAFLDEYQSDKVFSSIDRQGRYCFSNQIAIAQWNILRLAECLIPLIDTNTKMAEQKIEEEVITLFPLFQREKTEAFTRKLGLANSGTAEQTLYEDFLHYLEQESLDFTLSFRNLPRLLEGETSFYPQTEQFKNFLFNWNNLNPDKDNLNKNNSYLIPRNHLIQQAIDDAYNGDLQLFIQMVEVLKKPFTTNLESALFATPPRPTQRVCQTFCGT